MVHFADYIYSIPKSAKNLIGREAGEWTIIEVDRYVDREKFEEFKTLYYELEGWDPATGYPTRSTLEALDLAYVADELEENEKLGME
jgi:aldehyde:ferredoxin oxidoreductase